MTIYATTTQKDSLFAKEIRRKSDEAKLTYAQYDGSIPKDDDPADYYPYIKAVSIA